MLVVEDERELAGALEVAIDVQPGLECVGVVGTIDEALQAVDATGPDIVLMDVHLPGVDGIEGTRRIKATNPHASVFILTGDATPDLLAAATSAGAAGFLAKDSGLTDVLTAIQTPVEGIIFVDGATLGALVAGVEEAHLSLEHAVDERTAALAARTAELARSNDRLQEFVCVVAHDLRNPLVAMGGLAEAMQTSPSPPPDTHDKVLGTIATSSQEAIGMIDDLLAYARASGDIAPEPVSLDEQVQRAIRAVQPLLDRWAATVVVASPLPTVVGYPLALCRVFQNLVSNAVLYRHPDRSPVITITAEAAGGGWRITVADNGLGIPPGREEVIFSPGVRLNANHEPGTGFGLAEARMLIERHRGRITAHADPDGPGARFVIDLPGEAPDVGRVA